MICYQSSKARIKINGHLSDPFPILRGVRQGDPLSPLLFTLVIECLIIALKKAPGFEGISIPGFTEALKVSLYADDTTIFFNNPLQLQLVFPVIDLYCCASDAKLNLGKCQGVVLNQPLPTNDLRFGIDWLPLVHHLTHLGIPVGTKIPLDLIWSETLGKIESSFKQWSKRKLTLTGRSLITKALGLSRVVYLSFAISIPSSILKKLNSLIWKFIWNGKRDKVARATTMQPLTRGGLNCFHIPSFISSFHLKMLQRIISRPDQPWTHYWIYRLERSSQDWKLSLSDLLISKIPSSHLDLPDFWKSALLALQQLNPSFQHRPNLNLFLNPTITIDGKPLSQRRWKNLYLRGLVSVDQIWNGTQFRTIQQIRTESGVGIANKTLQTIVDAIPLDWIEHLHFHHLPPPLLSSLQLLTKVGPLLFANVTSKDLRTYLTDSKLSPSSGTLYWTSRWDPGLDWSIVWKNVQLIPFNKPKDVAWLLLHRKLPLFECMTKWFPELPFECPFCNMDASHPHVFVNCLTAQEIWKHTLLILSTTFPQSLFSPTEQFFITGIHLDFLDSVNATFWRAVHSITINTIWNNFCKAKFGRKMVPLPESLNTLKINLKTNLISTQSPFIQIIDFLL